MRDARSQPKRSAMSSVDSQQTASIAQAGRSYKLPTTALRALKDPPRRRLATSTAACKEGGGGRVWWSVVVIGVAFDRSYGGVAACPSALLISPDTPHHA